jgi:hypothetical protein
MSPSRNLVWGIRRLLVAAALVAPRSLHAQDTAERLPAFTGLSLGLDLVRTSAWSFDEQIPELGRDQHYDIPSAGGLGFSVSYALTPYLAPFVAASLSLYGSELSGFSTYQAGIEGRLPQAGRRLLPFAQASLGRLSWSGNMRYGFVEAGAGTELFPFERVALRLALQGAWPLGDGRRNVGSSEAPIYRTTRLDAGQLRFSLGGRWHFGRRSGSGLRWLTAENGRT